MRYEASVIIPAYNEQENIGKVLAGIKKLNRKYHVVVVDDGSKDKTSEIAVSYGVHVVRLEKNRGKGYACRTGVKHAKSEFLVFIDADFQFNPKHIPQFVDRLKDNDMVVGARRYEDIPIARRFSNRFARFIVNKATGQNFSDVLCGYRAIKRSKFFALNLKENDYKIESEIMIKSSKKKFKISELPITVSYNGGGMGIRDSLKVSAYQLRHIVKKNK